MDGLTKAPPWRRIVLVAWRALPRRRPRDTPLEHYFSRFFLEQCNTRPQETPWPTKNRVLFFCRVPSGMQKVVPEGAILAMTLAVPPRRQPFLLFLARWTCSAGIQTKKRIVTCRWSKLYKNHDKG
ncbi:hypothetical protein TW95_gp1062 [Pandoravirus inopinatum]|uniref:Uncharacterized protein n=1 Tax=Pandoravirus inopinatum TaxID=1605721 RepID=A0A0B5JA72_9VIRU|nr:hypothetical protein TW95_gp1062 [Pandoravirus inopinatum]AJF97796.1 hypothetical protein [Pandoravirus inopinatum]